MGKRYRIATIFLIISGVAILNMACKTKGSRTEIRANEKESVQISGVDNFPEKEAVKAQFKKYRLEKYWKTFEPKLRDEIRVEVITGIESEMLPGCSKIGGRPDLPEGTDWFYEKGGKPLSFIAQVNLEETREFDKSGELPDSGIVYFFYSAEQDAWGFDSADIDKFRVFYSAETDKLVRTDFPDSLNDYSRYKPCFLEFSSSISLPAWDSEFTQKHLSKKEIDRYYDMTAQGLSNKLLGYSDNIQGEMELECQLVTNGLYCGDPSGYNDPRRKELEKGADDWQLLFQLDSETDKTGMIWGDAGRLYFWIRKKDLKNSNFNDAWFMLQCY